jgi:hypothetical protein
MVTYFNEKDMVSFGLYLLSDERKQRFQESYKEAIRNGIKNPLPPEESLKLVHHADVENWKHKQTSTKSASKSNKTVEVAIPRHISLIFLTEAIKKGITNIEQVVGTDKINTVYFEITTKSDRTEEIFELLERTIQKNTTSFLRE